MYDLSSVGQEFRSSLGRRFWFTVFPRVAINMSAMATVRLKDLIEAGVEEFVSLTWLLAG